MLVPKAPNANIDVSIATSFDATPARTTATNTLVELRVVKQTLLKAEESGMLKYVSKEIGLIYF